MLPIFRATAKACAGYDLATPTAITAMVRDGFPVDKIYYYRGGMLDWDALGFPIVKGDF